MSVEVSRQDYLCSADCTDRRHTAQLSQAHQAYVDFVVLLHVTVTKCWLISNLLTAECNFEQLHRDSIDIESWRLDEIVQNLVIVFLVGNALVLAFAALDQFLKDTGFTNQTDNIRDDHCLLDVLDCLEDVSGVFRR